MESKPYKYFPNQIIMFRGDNHVAQITIKWRNPESGEAEEYDLDGYELVMEVKEYVEVDKDEDIIFFKSTNNHEEGELIESPNGVLSIGRFIIKPEDTINLREAYNYRVIFYVVTDNLKRFTVLKTWLTLKSN